MVCPISVKTAPMKAGLCQPDTWDIRCGRMGRKKPRVPMSMPRTAPKTGWGM